jgi:glycosyltransferase involved in cell wall biosynthesis
MNIAIMMRAMDQDTGFRAYVEGLVHAMLQVGPEHSYLLLYRTPKWVGRFSGFANAQEVLLCNHHKLIWDQVAVPYRAWKDGADVIFNPKFSVPLLSHCPVAMGLQEPAWWAWPHHHPWWDVRYMKAMLPLYCRKAAHIFPMSQFILDENRKYLGLPLPHSTVTYSAPNLQFRPIDDRAALEAFRRKYGLPDKFILSVTRVENIGNTGTTFCPTKNVDTIIRAFKISQKHTDRHLVVAGRRAHEYVQHMALRSPQLVHGRRNLPSW